MDGFWVVARGGEFDGAVGLLQLDGYPIGEHVDYRGFDSTAHYVVSDEVTTLPDGRAAYVAEREASTPERLGDAERLTGS